MNKPYKKMTFVIKTAPIWSRMDCCCFTCNIREAAVVLGWIKLVFTLSFLGLQVTCLVQDWVPQIISEIMTHTSKGVYSKVPEEVLIFSIVESSVSALLNMLYLMGLHIRKPVLMVPYLLMEIFFMATIIIGIVIVSSLNIAILNHALGIAVLVGGIIFVGVLIFIWETFYSFYRHLDDQQRLARGLYKVDIAPLTAN